VLVENLPDTAVDDHCPFCLKYPGLAAAREAGGRFCPECGADWDTLEGEFEAPEDSVVLSSDRLPLPPEVTPNGHLASAPLLDDQTPPPHTYTEPLPAEATELLPQVRPSKIGPITIGLVFALAATVAAGFVYQTFTEPEPVPRPPVAAVPPPPVAPKVAPPPKPPKPKLPSDPNAPARRIEAVEQAVQLATQHLPEAHTIEVTAQVRGSVAYLSGKVDSRRTLDLAQQAVAGVFGIDAVDTRGVKIVFRRHELTRGDTLSALAERYYGDPARWVDIWRANRNLAARPDALVAGTSLLIPTDQD